MINVQSFNPEKAQLQVETVSEARGCIDLFRVLGICRGGRRVIELSSATVNVLNLAGQAGLMFSVRSNNQVLERLAVARS